MTVLPDRTDILVTTADIEDAAVDQHGSRSVGENDLFDRSRIFAEWEGLPDWLLNTALTDIDLPQRITNVFRSARLATLRDVFRLGILRVLKLPNFGNKSLRDLAFAIQQHSEWQHQRRGEALQIQRVDLADADSSNEPSSPLQSFDDCDPNGLLAGRYSLPDWANAVPLRTLHVSVRVANALEKAHLEKVGDLIALGPLALRGLRNFGSKSFQELGMSVKREFQALTATTVADSIDPLSTTQELSERSKSSLQQQLQSSFGRLSQRDALVISRYLGEQGAPSTLEEIGGGLGITRERARQLRNRAFSYVRNHSPWPIELQRKVSLLLVSRNEPLFLDLLPCEDPWFEGFQDNIRFLGRVIEEFSEGAFHAWNLNERTLVSRCSEERWRYCVQAVCPALETFSSAPLSEREARMVVEGVATAQRAPELATALYEKIEPQLHFGSHPSKGQYLVSVGSGLRAAVQAILNQSERPLHMREIMDRLMSTGWAQRDDLPKRNAVRTALRLNGSLIFGRGVYGSERHLPLSPAQQQDLLLELESIVDDGPVARQWHCTELRDALLEIRPEFGDEIDQFIVNGLLARSQNLKYLGRFVWVRSEQHGQALQERREVADLCEEALVAAGRPLSKAELRRAIQCVRGLNHHFLPHATSRMVRLSHGLWGLSDRDVGVSHEAQQEALSALFLALEERQSGLHVSEIVDALTRVKREPDAELDENEILGLAQRDPRFRVGRGQLVGLSSWTSIRRKSIGEAFSRIEEDWTGPLTSSDLNKRLSDLLGRPLVPTATASHAARFGFTFDAQDGRWMPPVKAEAIDADEETEEDNGVT